MSGFVAIGLQIPTFARRGLYRRQLVYIHCICALHTRCHIADDGIACIDACGFVNHHTTNGDLVKYHIGCGGNADGITRLGNRDVFAWIKVNRFTCGNLLTCRAIVARQRPAFLQLGDVGAVLVNRRAVLRQGIRMLCQGVTVLVHHIAQVGHVGVGGIQLRAIDCIFGR